MRLSRISLKRALTTVAILATGAGLSALADTAHAQISGTIGGDLVDHGPLQMPCDPRITLAGGSVAIEAGRDSERRPTLRGCGGWIAQAGPSTGRELLDEYGARFYGL